MERWRESSEVENPDRGAMWGIIRRCLVFVHKLFTGIRLSPRRVS